MDKVGIIILNYNEAKDTLKCVESLGSVRYPNEIIVVDNHSTDDSEDVLKRKLPNDVIFISTDKNLGYAGGNNIGIKKALDLGCDYICVLNNDTEADSDFLTPCIVKLKEDSSIAFIGPTIVDFYTGKIQSQGATINVFNGNNKFINFKQNYPSNKPVVSCDYVGGRA